MERIGDHMGTGTHQVCRCEKARPNDSALCIMETHDAGVKWVKRVGHRASFVHVLPPEASRGGGRERGSCRFHASVTVKLASASALARMTPVFALNLIPNSTPISSALKSLKVARTVCATGLICSRASANRSLALTT